MRFSLVVTMLISLAGSARADYQLFYVNGKAGVRDLEGNVVIPAAFDALGWSDGSFSVVNSVTGYRSDGRWGLINLKKELITKAQYENLTSGGGDRVVASRWINPYSKKFGCLDLHGTETVPFRYESVQILGLRAVVCVRNGPRYEYGVIDLDDHSIVKAAYRDVRAIGSLRFAVQDFNLKTALYSDEGARLTEFNIDSISSFHKGIALLYEDLKVGAINRSGDVIVQPAYRKIEIGDDGRIRALSYPVWKEFDSTNKEVRRVVADSLLADDGGYIVSIAGMKGTLNRELKPVIGIRYSRLSAAQSNLRTAYRNGKAGIIRSNGTVVIPFEYDSIYLQGDLLRALQVRGGLNQWSVYDTFGIRKTEKTYDYLGAYNGRYFTALRNGFWGAVDRTGREILDCVYDSIIGSCYEMTAVRFKGLYGIIDRTEKWIVTPHSYPLSLASDDVYMERNDTILFVKDIRGQIIYFTTNPLSVVHDGFREVTADGNVKFVSWQGISRYEAAPPSAISTERIFEESEGMRGIQRDGRYGFIDRRGRLRIANRYEDIGKFSEGFAPVKILGKWGFVNMEDNVVINPNYERVTEFSHGISVAVRGGKYGVIARDGSILLPFRYDSIQIIDERLALVAKGKRGLAALSGHVLIEPRFDVLRVVKDNRVMVSDGKLWGVLTEDGLPVIPMMYSALCYNPETDHFLGREESGWVTVSGSE
jgi:hypothetical protein